MCEDDIEPKVIIAKNNYNTVAAQPTSLSDNNKSNKIVLNHRRVQLETGITF